MPSLFLYWKTSRSFIGVRRSMNSETRIHLAVVRWWDLAASGYGLDKRLLAHAANGGRRSRVEAAIFKGMAVRAGWPDLQLAVPRGDKHGLFLELKSPDGRISPEQKEILSLLHAQGYAVCVAWSFDEGIGAIINYLKTGNPLLKK